jgi:hypothetical protein
VTLTQLPPASSVSRASSNPGCPTTQPCLDQATIDQVKAWVSQGALNN